MKKIFIFLLLVGTAVSIQAAPKKKAAKSPLKTTVDTVSYALGMQVGADFSNNLKNVPGEPLNLDLFIEALTKELKGDSAGLLLKKDDLMQILQNYFTKLEAEAAKKTETENNLFLENNKKNKNVITTASGLQYEVVVMGDGAKPKATDKVKVHYHGTLTDGTVFDSSVDRGQPIEFELDKVIPGWTEGVQLMPVGSKFRFFIPPALGYGPNAVGNIKANSILIFDVELLDLTPAQNTIPLEPYQKD